VKQRELELGLPIRLCHYPNILNLSPTNKKCLIQDLLLILLFCSLVIGGLFLIVSSALSTPQREYNKNLIVNN
jgi:hypothetical protein